VREIFANCLKIAQQSHTPLPCSLYVHAAMPPKLLTRIIVQTSRCTRADARFPVPWMRKVACKQTNLDRESMILSNRVVLAIEWCLVLTSGGFECLMWREL
jgi:hypothetical protein